MRTTLALTFTTLLTLNTYGQQSGDGSMASIVTNVENTEMARLPYAIDVLKQIPKLTVNANSITVLGRGTPAIYVENRKVTDLSELSQIPASKVSSIKVITQPGAEYGKDVQSVIVINIIKEDRDGFRLNETMRLDMTHKLSANNETRLGWKHDAFDLGAFFAFNEENKLFEKKTFKRFYKNQQQTEEENTAQTIDTYKQRWTGRLNARYYIDEDNLLSANYSYTNLRTDRTHIPENLQTNRAPETRHDIGVEYSGKIGEWVINVGNNTFFDNIDQHTFKPTSLGYYLRKEYDIRTYAKAKTALWKGNIQVGAEHEFDHMDVNKGDESQMSSEFLQKYGGIHALHPDHTHAAFLSTSQKFGKWTVEGGLRYEFRSSTYKPCEDDGLMKFLDDWKRDRDELVVDLTSDNPIGLLARNGKLTTKRNFLYPTLKVSTKIGKSNIALLHTQSSVRPYLGLTRLTVNDIENSFVEDKVLVTEKIATTSLDWSYLWANLTATFTRYSDPICSTIDGTVKYNAPDYDAFDLNATLSPKIGIWSPVLNANMHKQWFSMPLANGKDKLHNILLKFSLNNTFSLPSNWLILLSANWHGKGGERNWYYYKPDFCLDGSIQKEFTHPRLTVILSATNILKSSYSDVTRYTQAFNNVSEGARERIVRMVSLSINYKL